MSYKTPGVYVKEVTVFPPSVAEVETAIPAFIGYTERAEKDGGNLLNRPTKIGSLLDYNEYFGGGHEITAVNVTVDENNNYAVTSVGITTRFHMYEALRLFFDNGGGDCYIVSVGSYSDTLAIGDENANTPGFRVGLHAVAQYDEPTILLFPDAVELTDEGQFFGLQQMALAQCNRLQDRVALMDLKENILGGWRDSVDNFRNGIGINNLKYGAIYTPFVRTSYPKEVPFTLFRNSVIDSILANVNLATLTTDSNINALIDNVNTAIADQAVFIASVDTVDGTVDQRNTIPDVYRGLRDTLRLGNNAAAPANLIAILAFITTAVTETITWRTAFNGNNLLNDLNAYASGSLGPVLRSLIALEKNLGIIGVTSRVPDTVYGGFDTLGWLGTVGDVTTAVAASGTDYTNTGANNDLQTALAAMGDIDNILSELMGFYNSIETAAETHVDLLTDTLYQTHTIIGNIVKHIKVTMTTTPPSGAIAGLYAYVDDNRGVFKAPANVSIASVNGPNVIIDDNIQEGLNVDVTAGKSINAIRSFTGKGTLVWGARTLAGNDNEWRYVPVRRFFNMVEESIKKSTGWAVFEPNDSNTWSLVRSMINNYLYDKWQEGALQGATPDEAYFVHIGEGLTFTPAEKLQGIMRVKIGMAVVRPAEFILLEFSHKMSGT